MSHTACSGLSHCGNAVLDSRYVVMKSPKAVKRPQGPDTTSSWLERHFEITKRGSSVSRELRGGLVTFFAMAYIVILNPLIIGLAPDVNGNLISGAPADAEGAAAASLAMVGAATALVAGLLTILMGVIGRFPMALAAGLGLNALVAYSLASQMTWPQAMGLVVWEGIIITILVLTGFRTAVFKAVPKTLRTAISVGIGLFIAFIGLVNAGFVRRGVGTPVQLGADGTLNGWPVLVFVIGLALLIALHVLKVKGSMLIAILATTVLAVIIQAFTKLSTQGSPVDPNPLGWSLNAPELGAFSWPDLSLLFRVDMFGAFFPNGSFSLVNFMAVLLLVFSLLLADFFDTMGTMVAVGSEGGLLDEDGMPPRTTEILLVDSIAAAAGGLGSVSSNTSYLESTAGVGDGARTGLASVFTGITFLVAMFLSPLVTLVPFEAASPVLVFVGFLMISQVVDVDWTDPEVGIPAFLTIILMPFAYSITVGIGVGFIAHVVIKLIKGHARRIHPLMYLVAAMFIIYFVHGSVLAFLRGA